MVVDEKTDFRPIARAGGTVLSYRADDFIFREGDTAAFMYIVLTGSVEMSTRDKRQGRRDDPRGQALRHAVPDRQQAEANTARAKEDCELALLDARAFRIMVENRRNSSGT